MSLPEQASAADAAYTAAIAWLYDRIDYERTRPVSQEPFRLERIQRLLTLIGSPHLRIPAIHIAGTKGKGSTAAMIESIARHAGIRTGLFTSPHIEQFEERMRVNSHMPSPETLTRLVQQLRNLLESPQVDDADRMPTFFEAATLLAWMLFDEQQVQLAVLETGLGGRLDCTNVCSPVVTVITSIGFDHMAILGNTLDRIAAEKAGIIKNGVPIVQGLLPAEADSVVAARAAELGCRRYVCGTDFTWTEDAFADARHVRRRSQQIDFWTPGGVCRAATLPLLGKHQAHNASLAVMAAELAATHWPQIDQQAISSGLRETRWPLRFEVLEGQPTVVLDAAHNTDSLKALTQVLSAAEWQQRQRVLVFAVSSDKDYRSMLREILPHFDAVVLTRFSINPRSVAPEFLAELATELAAGGLQVPPLQLADSAAVAMTAARRTAGPAGVVIVTGSIFLAAETRGLLTDAPPVPRGQLSAAP